MIDNKTFMLAGNAIFTVDNGRGEHFTFRCKKPDSPQTAALAALDCYYFSVLTGPDNTKNYTYLGLLDARSATLRSTRGSKIGEDAKSWKVAAWIVRKILSNQPLPEGYKIHHEGRCCRCGRLLTVPESIESGVGPECAGRLAESLLD